MRDFGLSEHIIAGMLLVVGFLSVAGNAWGQGQVASGKETTTSRLVWVDVVESVKFHKRWSLQAEVSERFFFDPVQQSQAMMRVYGFYNAGEGWSLGPVFSAWVNRTGSAYTYELRPAQAFVYKQKMEKVKKLGIQHRIIVEERWTRNVAGDKLAEGHTFSLRFRYRFWIEYTLATLGKNALPLKLFANDEVFLQAGKDIVYNTFQQNRFFTGLSISPVKTLTISAGYLNQYAQGRAGYKYEQTHTLRIAIQHTLDLSQRD